MQQCKSCKLLKEENEALRARLALLEARLQHPPRSPDDSLSSNNQRHLPPNDLESGNQPSPGELLCKINNLSYQSKLISL